MRPWWLDSRILKASSRGIFAKSTSLSVSPPTSTFTSPAIRGDAYEIQLHRRRIRTKMRRNGKRAHPRWPFRSAVMWVPAQIRGTVRIAWECASLCMLLFSPLIMLHRVESKTVTLSHADRVDVAGRGTETKSSQPDHCCSGSHRVACIV